jgi:rod shape-determining protein MreD
MNRELQSTNWVALTVFAVTGYALIFAEARFTAFRDLTGAQIDFLPGLIVYASLVFRLEIVLGCAAAFGLLFDSMSANPLGTTFCTLAVIGLFGWRFRELLLSDQFTTHWVLGLAASAVAPLLTVGLLELTGAEPLLRWESLWQWAVMAAGGGLVTPVWFRLFNRLDDALRYKELPESTFRPDRQIARGRH